MSYTSYNQMTDLIKREADFKGNTMSAYHDPSGNYIIKSYETEIARVHSSDGFKHFVPKFYSRTTSRHQGIVKRAWGIQ